MAKDKAEMRRAGRSRLPKLCRNLQRQLLAVTRGKYPLLETFPTGFPFAIVLRSIFIELRLQRDIDHFFYYHFYFRIKRTEPFKNFLLTIYAIYVRT